MTAEDISLLFCLIWYERLFELYSLLKERRIRELVGTLESACDGLYFNIGLCGAFIKNLALVLCCCLRSWPRNLVTVRMSRAFSASSEALGFSLKSIIRLPESPSWKANNLLFLVIFLSRNRLLERPVGSADCARSLRVYLMLSWVVSRFPCSASLFLLALRLSCRIFRYLVVFFMLSEGLR